MSKVDDYLAAHRKFCDIKSVKLASGVDPSHIKKRFGSTAEEMKEEMDRIYGEMTQRERFHLDCFGLKYDIKPIFTITPLEEENG